MKNPPPLDPRNGVSTTYDEVMATEKPPLATWSDVKSAFGEDAVNTGTVNLDLSTPDGVKNRGKLQEMVKKHMGYEAARGLKRDAAVETVQMRTSDGGIKPVPERLAERAESKGFRVVPRRKATSRWMNGEWVRV